MLIWVVYGNIYLSDIKIFIETKFTWYAQLSGLVLKKRKTIKNFSEKPHFNQEKKLLWVISYNHVKFDQMESLNIGWENWFFCWLVAV